MKVLYRRSVVRLLGEIWWPMGSLAAFAADLLGAALSEVNWTEIAEAFREDAE